MYDQLIGSWLTNLFTLKIHLFYEEKNKKRKNLNSRGLTLEALTSWLRRKETRFDSSTNIWRPPHFKSTVHIMFPLICHLIYGIFSDTLGYRISQNKN